MNYESICSGIEAASVAWEELGWTPVGFSEIDPFACAVLAERFPNVPNRGDLAGFREWPDATVDVLFGGTPCQSFSVAGLREGLADPRGNLALTYLALAERRRARWLGWENVPGIFSAEGGESFRTFLSGLVRWDVGRPEGGWQNSGIIQPNPHDPAAYGVAWRVLDAQYFGVPQRRRRVFLVGHIGAWEPAAAVLFEPEGMRGDRPPSREARPVAAGAAGSGAAVGCGDVSPAVTSKWSKGTGGPAGDEVQNLVAVPITFDETQIAHPANRSKCEPGAPAPALASSARPPTLVTLEGGRLVVRRKTPLECERLQGFPDDWTLVEHRGAPAKDSPRYIALGNSMPVPVMRWIGEKIAAVDVLLAELAA